MTMIEKQYDPIKIEQRWYDYWLKQNYFHADPVSDKKPFCIMLPPPNVTGVLHMGHALQNTIQDTLIRYYRLQGRAALWMPGTDHAGIATQNVVEQKLRDEGIEPEGIGRDAFIERVWEWKDKHNNIIRKQQEKLGSSCDWERERFTMDEGLSRAVRTVFVTLFEQGLIYKGNYIVNWCPNHMTAISDEEVKHVEHEGNLWFINYPLTDGSGSIPVATTRPETMLGDTAVAVNPGDERYKSLIGKTVTLPIVNREIPVIDDEFVDSGFGTGAVKVTPAHDPNDYDMGIRHGLPQIIVIDEAGNMTREAGKSFEGLERYDCRKKLVADLDAQGYLQKIEPHTHSIGKCHRCMTTIEPLLSEQWFLKMKPLAEKAIKAVRNGEIQFFPPKWEKDYFYWMENIRDWCISRQLWWGHRIPVWYCGACGKLTVSKDDPEMCIHCNSENIKQDDDVLDTWFSSWLWPFSTLNWPEDTPELRYFYPTSVLVSGYDILFFWIARMIMAGLWFTGKNPFHSVYITGMIKDDLGRIMSKSLGNGIDPIEMVRKYGADAVRYSLVTLSTDGQDIKLSTKKFEMGRNFANKIWNAYRFLKIKDSELTGISRETDRIRMSDDLSDRWIVSRLQSTWKIVNDKFSQYKLNEAINALYAFLWHEFCDWYIEILKDRLASGSHDAGDSLRFVALPTLNKTMELLHPFMPFITEEIWQKIETRLHGESIMVHEAGEPDTSKIDPVSEDAMKLIQDIIYSVRNIRGEMRIPHSKKAQLFIKCTKTTMRKIIEDNSEYLYRLGGILSISMGEDIVRPQKSATAVLPEIELYVPLENLIDIESEHTRLQKAVARLENQIVSIRNKLADKNFLSNAPEMVVDKERLKLETFSNNKEKLQENLSALEL